MQPPFTRSILLPSEDATTRFASRLAPLLGPGDAILLQGGLGAGKTHFARGLIQARLAANGLIEDVPSPTFTLVQTYWDGVVEIWHCDLYRLTNADETYELGLDEAFTEAICLIEWPERLAERPADALSLTFEMGTAADARQVTMASDSARWVDLLDQLDGFDV